MAYGAYKRTVETKGDRTIQEHLAKYHDGVRVQRVSEHKIVVSFLLPSRTRGGAQSYNVDTKLMEAVENPPQR